MPRSDSSQVVRLGLIVVLVVLFVGSVAYSLRTVGHSVDGKRLGEPGVTELSLTDQVQRGSDGKLTNPWAAKASASPKPQPAATQKKKATPAKAATVAKKAAPAVKAAVVKRAPAKKVAPAKPQVRKVAVRKPVANKPAVKKPAAKPAPKPQAPAPSKPKACPT